LEVEIVQLTEGKCFFCANFLSNPQKTWTIDNVDVVTGSAKSPPGGLTAPTIVMEPVLSGEPRQTALPAL